MRLNITFLLSIIIASVVAFPLYSEIKPEDEYRLACLGERISRLPYSERKSYHKGGGYVLKESTIAVDKENNRTGIIEIKSHGSETGGLQGFYLRVQPDITDENNNFIVLHLKPHDKSCEIRRIKSIEGYGFLEYRFKRYKSAYTNTIFFGEDGMTFGYQGKGENGDTMYLFTNENFYNILKNRLQKYIDAGWCEPE